MKPYWFYHRHFRLVEIGDLVEVWNARASVKSPEGQVRTAVVTAKNEEEFRLSFRKYEDDKPWLTIDERGPWRWRILKKNKSQTTLDKDCD